jgi:hypothetical protein
VLYNIFASLGSSQVKKEKKRKIFLADFDILCCGIIC